MESMTMSVGSSVVPLWNISVLRDELRRGLSPIQSLAYLQLAVVMCGLPQLVPSSALPWPIATNVALMVVAIGGTLVAYLRNGSQAGVRFVERMVAISVVIGFRYTLLVAVPVTLLVYLIISFTCGLGTEATTLDSIATVAITMGYFERVAHHISKVAGARDEQGHG
jgi:hypothetical protein